MEKFVRLNDYEPDPDEMEAGVGELARFGSFGTATAYARKNNMKRAEDVYELPALEVYNTLLYDFIEWDIQRKTARVRERNRKIASQQNR